MENKASYILDYFWDLYVPLNQFLIEDRAEVFNRSELNMREDEVVGCLLSLLKKNYISYEGGNIFLTDKGGDLWAKSFEVNWAKYVESSTLIDTDEDTGVYDFICFDEGALSQFILLNDFLFNCEVSQINDWSPAYWVDKRIAYKVSKEINHNDLRNILIPEWRKYEIN